MNKPVDLQTFVEFIRIIFTSILMIRNDGMTNMSRAWRMGQTWYPFQRAWANNRA